MAAPRWDLAIAPAATLSAAPYPPFWVSVAQRVMRQTTASTGMQYELAQAQTGEMHPVLENRDAAFNPVNTSSPYSPNVAPFRPLRWRAQYPSTVQLLTGDQATMGDASGLAAGTLATAFGMASAYDANSQIVTAGDAWQGTRVLSASVANGVTLGFRIFVATQWTMYPNVAHAFQARFRVPTGSVSPTVHALIRWLDTNGVEISRVAGTTTSITGGSTTWVQLSVSATPPANAAGADVGIILDSASGAFVAQTDGWQVELAAAPSAWVQPGTWYNVFYGGAERWPQQYTMNGTFGQTQPVITDAFALLSGMYPLPAFYSDVLALNPDFFFPLNDPSGSTVFADLTGKHNPAPLAVSPYGSGTVAAGQGIQSASTSGTFAGAPGPTVAITNPNTGTNPNLVACSSIQLDAVGITGPPATGGWTRMIAFNNSGAGSGAAGGYLWFTTNAGWDASQTDVSVRFGNSSAGGSGISLGTQGPNGATAFSSYNPPAGSYADGNWHLLLFTLSSDGKTFQVYLDGVNVYSNTTTDSQNPTQVMYDNIGAIFHSPDQFNGGYNGNVAHVGQFPFVLSSTQVANLYTSWKTSWQGDTSGQRYSRILGYAGYAGQTNIATGSTSDMGPATDIDGKTDALTLLQNVVTTENGVHYVSPAGPLTFEARTSRYDKLTPTYTFGENVAGGEWPYEDVGFDYDTTHVIGQTQITQNSTGQIFVANSPTTLAPNYRPTYQRTINVTNPQECIDAANYLANRYAQPQLRVQKIQLHPAAVANMWPIVLALTLSTRVRVMRRPPAYTTGTAIQFDGFIETIQWAVDWDTGDAIVTLEISPADLQLYWVLSALHTTLKNSATSGTNSITCNPLADSASNPAAASFCSGLQITLEPGTANAETLTVASFGATSPGYTSFTITFTANMAHNHAANAVVCEALPAGTTDPTTWDAASILGTSTTLAY